MNRNSVKIKEVDARKPKSVITIHEWRQLAEQSKRSASERQASAKKDSVPYHEIVFRNLLEVCDGHQERAVILWVMFRCQQIVQRRIGTRDSCYIEYELECLAKKLNTSVSRLKIHLNALWKMGLIWTDDEKPGIYLMGLTDGAFEKVAYGELGINALAIILPLGDKKSPIVFDGEVDASFIGFKQFSFGYLARHF